MTILIFKALYFQKWKLFYDEIYTRHKKNIGQVIVVDHEGKPCEMCNSVVICTNIIMVHYTRILQTLRRTVHNWENIHVNLGYAYSMIYYAMVRMTAKMKRMQRRQWNFAKVCIFVFFSVF